MPTFNELIDNFVSSRIVPNIEGEITESNSGYKAIGHELHEVDSVTKATRAVAGWQDPGGNDVMIWINIHWRGYARENLELRLKKLPMVAFTVMPTEEYDDNGADVIWWAHPIECMSCSEPLTDEQRTVGICEACIKLRSSHLGLPEHEDSPGIELRRGLDGDPLPRNRPSRG